MNKEELIVKLQMVYVVDLNALNEMIGYYDGLKEVIEMVQQENKELHNRIDKAIEILNNPWSFESGNKEVDEITYQKKREIIETLKDNE